MLHENYGFAGPALVNHLLDNRALWDEWRRLYREYLLQYEHRGGDDPVVCRMAQPLAAVTVAAHLAHQAMQLPWSFSDPVLPLWEVLTTEAGDADQSMAALEHALDWACGHQHAFFGRGRSSRSRRSAENQPTEGQPMTGWAGRWDRGGAWLGFRPEQLEKVLKAGGFDVAATIRSWGDRGWILLDHSSGKRRHRTRIGEESAWVVAIRQEAIREVVGVAEPEDGQQGEEVRLADVG